MSTHGFSIKSKESFGANKTGHTHTYYPHNEENMTRQVSTTTTHHTAMEINSWSTKVFSWTIITAGNYKFMINGLQPDSYYQLWINTTHQKIKSKSDSSFSINNRCAATCKFLIVQI